LASPVGGNRDYRQSGSGFCVPLPCLRMFLRRFGLLHSRP
jgi:hypothetical protein